MRLREGTCLVIDGREDDFVVFILYTLLSLPLVE